MRPFVPLVLAVLLGGCVHAPRDPDRSARPPAVPRTVVIRDARVFTAGPSGVLEHTDVRLAGGLVTDLAPAPSALAGDDEVDGRGRTLLPGLVDLHVHLALTAAPPWFLTLPTPARNARAMAWSGITTVLDVGGSSEVLARLKRDAEAGRWVGPRIAWAGQGLTVEDAYPLNMARELYGALAWRSLRGRHYVPVRGVADIERRVDRMADGGAAFVKLVVASIPPADPPSPRLTEAEIDAAVQRAHARGLRVAAHVDTSADALLCARAGVDLLAHGVETSRLTGEEIATLAASGIAFTPTLVNWHRFDDLTRFAFEPTAAERETQPPALLAAFSEEELRAHESLLRESAFAAWADALDAHREDRVANARAMAEGGVPLLVGSDAQGSIGTFPGALHEELRLLVEAGIPPAVVLERATRGNALFLDPRANYGIIEPGRIADAVLVEGDPLADIGTTERIVQVWVGGVPVRGR